MAKRKRLRLAAADDRPHTSNVCSFLDKKRTAANPSAQASIRHFFVPKTLPHHRPRVRNPLTKIIPRTSNSKVQQMHLDLGQQMHKECSICGMFYSLGTEDEKSHLQFCQEYQHGVAISKNTKIIPYRRCCSKNDSILCIRPSDKSPSLRKKLTTVTRIVHAELGFCPYDDDNNATTTTRVVFTNYLFVRNSRIIGIVQTEPIVQAYTLLSPTERSRHPAKNSSSSIVGVHLLWVHERHRRTGIARQLMDAASTPRSSTSTVAFSSPSQAGIAFAQHYGRPVLVYDCGGGGGRAKCTPTSSSLEGT